MTAWQALLFTLGFMVVIIAFCVVLIIVATYVDRFINR